MQIAFRSQRRGIHVFPESKLRGAGITPNYQQWNDTNNTNVHKVLF